MNIGLALGDEATKSRVATMFDRKLEKWLKTQTINKKPILEVRR